MKKYPRSIQCASFRNRIEDDLDVAIGELKHTLDDIAMQPSNYTDAGIDLLTKYIIEFNKSLKLDMKLMNDGFTITSASEPDATYQNNRNTLEVDVMAASKLKVPSGLSKYYMLDEYGEYGDDIDDELQDILDSYELTFEGYAVAKDRYYDMLADEGYDILFICKDDKGKNGLYYTYSDRVLEITPNEIEMLLERYE